jgi:hypothetical protein
MLPSLLVRAARPCSSLVVPLYRHIPHPVQQCCPPCHAGAVRAPGRLGRGSDPPCCSAAQHTTAAVHLTGSAATYDAIVWQGRPKRGEPPLRKPVGAELG